MQAFFSSLLEPIRKEVESPESVVILCPCDRFARAAG
jgi:hypothetical protein